MNAISKWAMALTLPSGPVVVNPQTYSVSEPGSLGGSLSSVANAVNDSGQVTGQAVVSDNVKLHAFVYYHGVMQDLGTLGGDRSVVILAP
jgi:probable HAF family extracellular repeat protein